MSLETEFVTLDSEYVLCCVLELTVIVEHMVMDKMHARARYVVDISYFYAHQLNCVQGTPSYSYATANRGSFTGRGTAIGRDGAGLLDRLRGHTALA